MSIGTVTLNNSGGLGTSSPRGICAVSFTGDTSYTTGGTTGFAAKLKAAMKTAGKFIGDIAATNILGILPQDCGGYVVTYVPSTDALKVYYGNYDAADGPLIEVPPTTALNGVTFNVLVLLGD